MRRFIQVVILVNIAVVVVTTALEYVHDSSGASPLFNSALQDLVALSAAFVIAALVALVRFQTDPMWLLVPASFLIPLTLTGFYQAFAADGSFPRAVVRALLMAAYLVGYFVLRSAESGPSMRSARVPERG